MKQHRLVIALFTVMMFPLIIGKVRDKRHGIPEPASEHYVFEPVLTHCPTCIYEENIYSTKKQGGGHAQELEFSFVANGTRYDIALELNERLLSSGFSVSYLGYEGESPEIYKEKSVEELNNCYYHGHVIGVENSRVVASTCHGLKGTIYLHNDTIHFAPLEPDTRKHALYREVAGDDHSCGTSNDEMLRQSLTDSVSKSSPDRVKRQEEEQKFVELMFVVDKEMYEKFDEMAALHEHIKEIVNFMDVMYKLIQLRIVLMHLEVWTKEDKIEVSDDGKTTLQAFVVYRQQKLMSEPATSHWKYTDNAHLIVGRVFANNILGMAPVSAMCTDRSCGVTRDRIVPRDTAATATHEIGHNFGMNHDTESCDCTSTSGMCVMAASASRERPTDWSSCSRQYLESGYRSGLDVCLKNTPDSDKMFGGPECGNGIVEVNEECDCGPLEDCDSPCCNATTCKLHEEAKCDTGVCCSDDCQFRGACHVCRTAVGDCDITEYCSGEAAHCPDDIYKFNGYACDSGEGLCYSGACRTRENQCKEMFGTEAIDGLERCYATLNTKGLWYGHCSKNDDGSFNGCAAEDVFCGKLMCIGGSRKPIISTGSKTALTNMDGQQCKTAESPSGMADTLNDPTLVSDGTRCDDGKVCHNGACSDGTDIVKPCNRTCNGHGICNNLGNCHCDAGYAPPDCKEPGDGGSADSGPLCENGDNTTTTDVKPADNVDDDTQSTASTTSTTSTTTTTETASSGTGPPKIDNDPGDNTVDEVDVDLDEPSDTTENDTVHDNAHPTQFNLSTAVMETGNTTFAGGSLFLPSFRLLTVSAIFVLAMF